MSLSAHPAVQAGGWRKLPPSLSPTLECGDGRPAKRHDVARSHSESPSRLPINRAGTWKREHSKHSSSLPRVSTWRRTGSSSSILSASSESSEKARSEDEKPGSSGSGARPAKENQLPAKGTWRKVKENELSPTGPSQAASGAANGAEPKALLYQMAPAVSKTEDVWVRIEDCPINNPRSGRSPTALAPPVIEGSAAARDRKDGPARQSAGPETRLSSFVQADTPDPKGTAEARPGPHPAPEPGESAPAERAPFGAGGKHSSPGGAVAARVTPFNYNPSPRKSSADGAASRPSQIPTPVAAAKKRGDTKPDGGAEPSGSGAQSPKRHSGSYLVTSV